MPGTPTAAATSSDAQTKVDSVAATLSEEPVAHVAAESGAPGAPATVGDESQQNPPSAGGVAPPAAQAKQTKLFGEKAKAPAAKRAKVDK